MATSSKSRKQEHTTHTAGGGTHTHQAERQVQGMAETARRNYEQAVRMSQKLQEDAGEWWTRMLNQTTTVADWQKQYSHLTRLAADWTPVAQHGLHAAMDLFERTGRTSAELMRKAVDAAQTSGLADNQAKWLDFWTSSVKAAQANFESLTELSASTINSWIALARRNSDTTHLRVPKAA